MNAGGAITRVVRNAPDEGLYKTGGRGLGYYETSISQIENILDQEAYLFSNGQSWEATESNKMDRGEWDTEPDAFTYNVNGYTGKFYLNPGSPDVLLSSASSDVKIKVSWNTANKSFDYWTLITPEGIKYTFGVPNKNEYNGDDEAVDLTNNYVWQGGSSANRVVAAWYLTKIESTDGNHSINFNYTRERYRYTVRGSDIIPQPQGSPTANTSLAPGMFVDIDVTSNSGTTTFFHSYVNPEASSSTNNTSYGQSQGSSRDRLMHNEILAARLASISTTFEKAEFLVSTQNRKDLDPTTDIFNSLCGTNTSTADFAKALDNVVIKNTGNNQIFKKFKLNTDYFISNNAGFPNDGTTDEYPTDRYRLRLKSVVESDANETAASQKVYALDYINTNGTTTTEGVMSNLPRRKSAAVDAWGFYNGRNTNTGLIPYSEIYAGSSLEYGQPASADYNVSLGEITTQLSNYVGSWGSTAYSLFYSKIFGFESSSKYGVKAISTIYSGNRTPSAAHMVEGSLNKITYPTGGYTQFEYEPHTYKGKIEEFKFIYPFQTTGCSGCTIPYENSFNNCQAPNGVGASCIRDIKIKNAHFAANVPTQKLKFGLYLENKGNLAGGMTFNYIVKKNGTIIKTGPFSLQANEAQRTIVEDFMPYFWDGSAISPYDNIDIDILRTSTNGTPDTLCDIRFKVFYTTFGVVDGDKMGGGLRIKQVTSSEGTDMTKNIVTNYDYKNELGTFSSGVIASKIQTVYDLAVGAQDKIEQPRKPDIIIRNSTAYNDGNVPSGPIFGTRLYAPNGSALGPSSNNQSGMIGYKTVKVSQPNNGYSRYTYFIDQPYQDANHLPTYPEIPEYSISGKMGNLQKEEVFSATNNLLRQVDYEYGEVTSGTFQDFGSLAVSGIIFPKPNKGRLKKYRIRAGYHVYLTKKTELVDNLSTITNYTYDLTWKHHNTISTIVKNSDEVEYKTQYYYAEEMNNFALKERNMVAIPIKTEQYVGNNLKAGTWTIFNNTAANSAFPRPIEFKTLNSDGNTSQTWTTKYTIESYNALGFPTSGRAKGFNTSEIYNWTGKLLYSKTYGGLTWQYFYKLNTNLIEMMTDENGLRTKFTYDDLRRLSKTQNRFSGNIDDPQDIQATTLYTYHYSGQPAELPIDVNTNFVQTKSTFKGITTPLSTKQYMDGLGRPIEVVKEGYTPSGYHQKNYVAYDALGRQNKSYLPFEGTTLGYEVAPAYTSSYVLTEYETSPLSRPIKQTNVDNTVVATYYGTNVANDVRLFVAAGGSGGSVSGGSYYAANTLYKTTMIDENAKQTCVFKDKLGRVILTRKSLSGQNVDTYNVYDSYGQLVAVLPPGSVNSSGVVTNSLIFQYKYDVQNRVIEKAIPGADLQKFYYDSRDLLVLTQDGNMRVAKNPSTNADEPKHLATIYDDIGRPTKTGFILNLTPSLNTQGDCTTDITNLITDKLTETIYHPNKTWVKHQGAKVLKPAGVSTNTDFVWSYIERRAGLEYTGNPVWTGKQHLMYQYVAQRPIDDSDAEGVDWSVSAYNGMQQPDLTVRYLFTGSSTKEVKTINNFTYDNGRRLTNTKYNYALNGAGLTEATLNLSNMVYNYKDQLEEKNIGLNGTNALQSIDYTYNLRGWLTAINNMNLYGNNTPIMTPPMSGQGYIQNLAISPFIKQAISESLATPPMTDNNADLFSQALTYGSPDSRTGATPQYSGNISSTTWQVLGRAKQAYGFKYDDLDRLTESKYFDITDSYSSSNHQWSSSYSTDNKFQENVQYDVRGNITFLQRNGLNGGSWTSNGYTAATYGLIDNLGYNYGDSNRLMKVMDASYLDRGFKSVNNVNDRQYSYDKNGNLIQDVNKGITKIEYNYLNLPQVITFTGNRKIQFVYDASGVKLRKITIHNDTIITYDYVNGVEYKNNILQRIAHTEGSVERNEFGAYEHQYVLRDHLGNTRVTFRDGVNKGEAYFDWTTYQYIDPNAGNTTGLNDGTITSADIMQINNYYPFGLNMEGNWNGSQGGNKYQYNGKEWNDDFGLGMNDYGRRFYDPAIGRFPVIDRFSEKFVVVNPYQYGANNPIRFIDVNGDSIDVFGKDGSFMYTYDNGTGKSTNGGMMFTKSKTNKDGFSTYYDPISFGYNDPYEDHKSVVQDGYGVEIISDGTVEGMIDKSGVRSSEAQDNPTDYASRESRPTGNSSHYTLGMGKKGGGKMDYYQQNPDNIKSNTLSIIVQNGQGTAYNPKDFGNYMWGCGMKILGFSLSQSQMAAHGNNLLSGGRTDGGERTYLDTYGDQRAIKDGHNRGTNINSTNGVDTHTNWTAQAKKQ